MRPDCCWGQKEAACLLEVVTQDWDLDVIALAAADSRMALGRMGPAGVVAAVATGYTVAEEVDSTNRLDCKGHVEAVAIAVAEEAGSIEVKVVAIGCCC